MPFFDYTASDREGVLSHGRVEAADRAAAGRLLAKRGLFVMGVVAAPAAPNPTPTIPDSSSSDDLRLRARLEPAVIDDERTVAVGNLRRQGLQQRSWSQLDRALYLRQLQVMFAAGIPLYRAAAALAEGQERRPRVGAKLSAIPRDLERGRPLSGALEKSGLFTRVIVNSVRLGEESGRLSSILEALSETEERAVQLKRALVSRLTYPAVVLVAMVLGLMVLGHVMSDVMASLPTLQKSPPPVLGLLNRLFAHAAFLPTMLGACALLAVLLRRAWLRHRVRLPIEQAALSAPVLGPLLKRLESNSVSGHLALLLGAGLPLDQGLGFCADLVRTISFRQALQQAQQDLRNGEELAPCLKRAQLFPEDVLALIHAGEVAGSLEKSLANAARYCAEQVERTLESTLAVLEPLLIGLLGIAIGAVLILTFLPVFASLKDL